MGKKINFSIFGKTKGSDYLVTRDEICLWLNVQPSHISDMIRVGFPIPEKRGCYNLKDCVMFYSRHLQGLLKESHTESAAIERFRLLRAQADTALLRSEQLRGDLMSVEEAKTCVARILLELKDRLLCIPSQVSRDCVNIQDQHKIRDIFLEAIEQALCDASNKMQEIGSEP